jgi:hypothetical protein
MLSQGTPFMQNNFSVHTVPQNMMNERKMSKIKNKEEKQKQKVEEN